MPVTLGGRSRPPAPQERLDARHELARRERLGEVVVAADRETDDAVDLLRSAP